MYMYNKKKNRKRSANYGFREEANKMAFKPYSAQQQMNYQSCECDARNKPPGWLLDKIAEEKLKGGYNTRKSNLCTGCFQYKSVNGSCGCP